MYTDSGTIYYLHKFADDIRDNSISTNRSMGYIYKSRNTIVVTLIIFSDKNLYLEQNHFKSFGIKNDYSAGEISTFVELSFLKICLYDSW